MPPSTGQTPPGSSQSQGPREVAPTPAPRASVRNPGGGLHSLPHSLPLVFLTGFPSVSCSRLRARCGERLAQEGVPCARHTQRCMPMNESAGGLWTQGRLEAGREGRPALRVVHPTYRDARPGAAAGAAPVETAWRRQWKSRADAGQGWCGTGVKAAHSARGRVPPPQHPLTLTHGAGPACPSLER